MERKYSFEEVVAMDNILLQLAIYELTEGGMKPVMIRSEEEHNAFTDSIQKQWFEFKSLIRRGEMSFEELKTMVANRWGAIKSGENLSVENPNQVDNVIAEIEAENKERDGRESFAGIARLLSGIFGQQMLTAALPPLPPLPQLPQSDSKGNSPVDNSNGTPSLYNTGDEQKPPKAEKPKDKKPSTGSRKGSKNT